MNEVLTAIKKELWRWKNMLICLVSNKSIPYKAIPKTTQFGHYGIGVIINDDVILGDHCFIGHNVTIGSKNKGVPVIEDHVQIHANSVVIGAIKIGHHSVIGAGAVCFKDVPPYSLVTDTNNIKEGYYKKE